ncbi:MAG: c-type cytochrome biogenesis protein CcsB [Deltaproteobacteria bacterium]|nr:c-type cytochrome biogenesis protein CcsB [Deltaproteobacteria bacterium]
MRFFLYTTIIFYLLGFFVVIIHHLTKNNLIEKLSRASLVLGLASHTILLIIRTYETGHAPMANMYETLLFYSWSTVLVSVIVIFRYNERLTELITIPVAMLAMTFANANEKPGAPLTLILNTRWFETHVISSFAGYALFTLAFSGAVLYLVYPSPALTPTLSQRARERGASGEGEFLEKKNFQDIANRSILWGFFFFSVSMFSGAVWAYLAWGMYWLWEPKVIWSFIVWFYYAGAMHAYYVREWRGKGLAIATVIGFFVVLFTYLGVSLLMRSSHSF